MTAKTHKCSGCHGEIHGSRSVSLETAIKNHEASCPATKTKRSDGVTESKGSGGEHG